MANLACKGCEIFHVVENVRLEAENVRLEAEAERLKAGIEWLKRRLATAKWVAENIRWGAKERMDKGNLPRGNFAYLKGAYVSSEKISRTLG